MLFGYLDNGGLQGLFYERNCATGEVVPSAQPAGDIRRAPVRERSQLLLANPLLLHDRIYATGNAFSDFICRPVNDRDSVISILNDRTVNLDIAFAPHNINVVLSIPVITFCSRRSHFALWFLVSLFSSLVVFLVLQK